MTYEHAQWGRTHHGTPTGFSRHQELGQVPCDLCKAAKARYDARRVQREETKARKKVLSQARARALEELRRRHPQEFGNILLAEQEKLGVAYSA